MTVILADGDFPTSPQALSILENATYLCCCDNAAVHYIEWLNKKTDETPSLRKRAGGEVPNAIVGDGDSLPQSFKDKYASIYHQVDEQDYNDLTKATRFCIAQGFKAITYLGVTGKREDHTLANIGFVAYFKHTLGIEPTIVTDYGTFTIHVGDATLQTFPGQQVSIFNLSCTQLTSQNLKWQTYAFKELWQGALNEALTNQIHFTADGEYIVFRTHLA